MRETFLLATLATLVGCGPKSTTSIATANDPGGSAIPEHEGNSEGEPRERELWSAGVATAWRVEGVIRDVVALDEHRALAVGGARLHVIALDTGAVTSRAWSGDGTPLALVRAGGRVIAFGTAKDKRTAAWSIDPATFAVTPIALPDAPVGSSTDGVAGIAASPDGKRVVTCGADRWPAVRDAVTLAPVVTFADTRKCAGPRFVDDQQVAFDPLDARGAVRVGDLASGKVTTLKAGTPATLPGPGGRSVTIAPRKVTVSAGGREVATYAPSSFTAALWLGDGSAVVSPLAGKLTVLPAVAGGAPRTVEMPARLRQVEPIPATTKLLFQAGTHRLGVIDAASGAVLTAEGANLGDVERIAVVDGAVISAAERVRVWRDGAIVASGPLASVQMLDVDPGKPALYATFAGVFELDLATGAVAVFDRDAVSTAVDRHGDRILYDESEYVKAMGGGGGADGSWFERSDDFMVTDLDASNGRVAMTDEHGYYVAWPDQGKLFGFHPFDCDQPIDLFLERGRPRVATYDGVTVHLYDADRQTSLGGIELTDDNINGFAFIPGGDALVLVGADVYLWDPVEHSLVRWPMPAEHAGIGARAVAVDPTGTQIAIGFADGAVLWAKLAAIRARATPTTPDDATEQPPVKLTCKGKRLVTTLAEVRGPADGDGDADD